MDIVQRFKSVEDEDKYNFIQDVIYKEKIGLDDRVRLFQYMFEFEPEYARYVDDAFDNDTLQDFIKKSNFNKLTKGFEAIIKEEEFYLVKPFLDYFPEVGEMYFDSVIRYNPSYSNIDDAIYMIVEKGIYLPAYKMFKYADVRVNVFLLGLINNAVIYSKYELAKKILSEIIKYNPGDIDFYYIFINLSDITLENKFSKYVLREIIGIYSVFGIKDIIDNYYDDEKTMEKLYKIIPDEIENYKKSIQTKNVEIGDIENPFDYLEGLDLNKTNVVDDISNVIIKYKEELDGEIPLRIIEFLEETEVFDWIPLLIEYPEILDNMESLTMQEYEYLGNYRAVPKDALANPIYQDALSALEDSTRIGGNLIKEIVLEAIRKLFSKL